MKIFKLLKNLTFSQEEEVDQVIYEGEALKVLRTMSLNQTTDFMVQDQDEFVVLMKGKASIETSNDLVKMEEGDFLFIKKGVRHRVLDQDRAVWFCGFIKS